MMATARKKPSIRVKKALAEAVTKDVAKHSTYKPRTVYIPPSEDNDNAGYYHVSENVDINLMDSWLAHDDQFHGGHLRCAHRCRDLWNRMPKPTWRVSDDEGHSHAKAAKTLDAMKRAVRRSDWLVFENAMRFNEPCGYLGSRFANPVESHIAATKAIVRRVLEVISR